MSESLNQFFLNLGFDNKSDLITEDRLSAEIGQQAIFQYRIENITKIYFLYLRKENLNDSLLKAHQAIWNDNQTEVFIVISDDKTYLCASKYKPDNQAPKKCLLDSFDYGLNSLGLPPDKIQQLLKENIDYGSFWDLVRQKLKENRRKSVDDDLLLNLVLLKHNLKEFVSEEKTYILIERCLFLKFLEDRHFLQPHILIKILKSQDGNLLLNKFNEINGLLNGDIFGEKNLLIQDFTNPKQALLSLYNFFTTDYSKQMRLFPYNFSILPIELLSNIYETFLKIEEKIAGGVYYTHSILVDLILDETLTPLLRIGLNPTCLDFSCGSGMFLVKAFERLINHNNCHSDFEKKKELLKNHIFGIEKDGVAARITVFSLYLKLLEGENAENVRNLIQKENLKFPKLLNNNIQCKNTLFDMITFKNEDEKQFEVFDVLVGNPPWGVNPFKDPELPPGAEMQLSKEKQEAVTLPQSSQYFTLKAQDFMAKGAVAGILTNNSNLLASKSLSFRRRLLKNYDIDKIYDFMHCSQILFKKRRLNLPTEIVGKPVKIGADEPGVAIIFRNQEQSVDSVIKYIKPSLDQLGKILNIIWVKPSDVTSIPKKLLEDDILWKIISVGDIEDYELIQKLKQQKGRIPLKSVYGMRFKKSVFTICKELEFFDKDCIEHFLLKEPKKYKDVSIYKPGKFHPKQILVPTYIRKDFRIRAAYDHTGHRYHYSLIGVRTEDHNHTWLLALYNSLLISYFLHCTSAQIGKGTFNMLNENEIESIPVPAPENIPNDTLSQLTNLIDMVKVYGKVPSEILEQIDEIIFKIFHLKDYEKQRIRDFSAVIKRKNTPHELVGNIDLSQYAQRFRDVFKFILRDDKFLNAEAFTSSLLGAGITFTIVDCKSKNKKISIDTKSDLAKIIPRVAKRQLHKSEKTSLLKQEKLKLYTTNSFTILKSNYYKDWTETEAIKDAKEEIELFVQSLPER